MAATEWERFGRHRERNFTSGAGVQPVRNIGNSIHGQGARATVNMKPSPTIELAIDEDAEHVVCARADELSQSLGLPVVYAGAASGDMLLAVTPDHLELRIIGGNDPAIIGGRPLVIDWLNVNVSPGAGGRKSQPIAKSVGLGRKRRGGEHDGPLRIIDATAGLGEDAWLLAALGCEVTMIERCGVLAALLRDAQRRAAVMKPDIAARIAIEHGDAIAMLTEFDDTQAPDVVYLDPMFPAARKTLERKPLRILRQLVGDDDDSTQLFDTAMRCARRRVVVKRPSKAPPLAGRDPEVIHCGRAVRYDVYSTHIPEGNQ